MVNNQFYDTLGLDWWEARDHMIYFLRAESKIKLDYLLEAVGDVQNLEILDIGSGAGFISLPLAQMGAKITALDYSVQSLAQLMNKAKEFGVDSQIELVEADACSDLELNKKFDLVLAFDVLEHVPEPLKLVQNAAKYLKPKGQFFYHTLNRSFWCWFLYLQLVPRLIKRDPGDVHKHESNIKPTEMIDYLKQAGLKPSIQIGMRAPLFQQANWELITQRQVFTDLEFEFTEDLSLGYLGNASLVASENKSACFVM